MLLSERVANCFCRALDVLESEGAAENWLKTPIRSIGDVTPLSLLDTEVGYQLVLDTLSQIEHGVIA